MVDLPEPTEQREKGLDNLQLSALLLPSGHMVGTHMKCCLCSLFPLFLFFLKQIRFFCYKYS